MVHLSNSDEERKVLVRNRLTDFYLLWSKDVNTTLVTFETPRPSPTTTVPQYPEDEEVGEYR